MMRLLEDDNHLSVFRTPSDNSNGNTRRSAGPAAHSASTAARRVTRTELDGTITVIADSYNGKKLNAPNDVVVASNGSIWFTDPSYGIDGNYEGLKREQEQATHNVYRVDRTDRQRHRSWSMISCSPTASAFSPDEKKLYVIDSGTTHGGPGAYPRLRCRHRHRQGEQRQGLRRRLRARASPTACASTSTAMSGAAWAGPTRRRTACAATRPMATLLGKIHLPETCANVCFGGLLRNRLYMCASTSVYALYVNTQGAAKP